MPIHTSSHSEYRQRIRQWTRIRDCLNGEDAIKSKTYQYLPRLRNQSQHDYNIMLERGLFTSFTARILDGLAGMITRKDPELEYVAEMESYFEDSDNTGMSFWELREELARELLSQGRLFVFIDWKLEGSDPYILTAKTEQCINWKITDNKLEWIVIEESIEEPKSEKDIFDTEVKNQYRLLIVRDGVYTVEIYNHKGELVYTPVTPTNEGVTLDFIPGFFVDPAGINGPVVKPPFSDATSINIAHFRNSCDYESAIHLTASPFLCIIGSTSDSEITVGPSKALVLPDPASNAKWVDFNGEGLTSLENAMKDKITQLALFSSRISDQSTRGSESSTSVALRHGAESATLSTTARSIETALNLIYEYIANFKGVEAPDIELSRDFTSSKLTPAEQKALLDTYLAGAIDKEAYLDAIFKGELITFQAKERMEADPEDLGEMPGITGMVEPSDTMGRPPIEDNVDKLNNETGMMDK